MFVMAFVCKAGVRSSFFVLPNKSGVLLAAGSNSMLQLGRDACVEKTGHGVQQSRLQKWRIESLPVEGVDADADAAVAAAPAVFRDSCPLIRSQTNFPPGPSFPLRHRPWHELHVLSFSIIIQVTDLIHTTISTLLQAIHGIYA
jgi:hypothetical protein